MFFPSHKSKLLPPIFIKKASFYRKSRGKLNELLKCQNKLY